MICPDCGARAVDITMHGSTGPRTYLCIGTPPHEFLKGDGPTEEPEQDFDIDKLADAIADRVVERLIERKQPALFQRILASLK